MRTIKQWYQDLNLQSKFTLVLLVIVAIPAIAIIFFFYGNAYDMVVSYTIRQEQDRSAQTAPLIEESLQKILDVSTEISSLDFYQTLFKNAITDSFSDLAESEDAADFSDLIRQLTQDSSEGYLPFPGTGQGNLLVRNFQRNPGSPAVLPFLLSWCTGKESIRRPGLHYPCFRDL